MERAALVDVVLSQQRKLADAWPTVQAAQLPDLPGTLEELRTIATDFLSGRKSFFIGSDATEANAVARVTQQADILMFATHSRVARKHAESSDLSIGVVCNGVIDWLELAAIRRIG